MKQEQTHLKSGVPLCFSCRYFHRENAGKFSCDAFDEIPVEMLLGRRSHATPLPGQINAVVYEKVSDYEEEELLHSSVLGKLSMAAEKLAELHFIAVEKFEKVMVRNFQPKE